uniref:Nuclear receptor domain-containing protein n=1 Tax=Caenorhabditis tropicalis TaxID=1561998 RepID=A0A1I7UN19_9PELO
MPFSPSTSSQEETPTSLTCSVCSQPARGKHFGAIACRACAAFYRAPGQKLTGLRYLERLKNAKNPSFSKPSHDYTLLNGLFTLNLNIHIPTTVTSSRRADASKTIIKACKKGGNCQSLLNNNGWFDCKYCRLQKCYQVGMNSSNFQFDRDPISTKFTEPGVPKSMECFLGRPHCVIFVEPERVVLKKELIDCSELVEKARGILEEGPGTPFSCKSPLLKLAQALQNLELSHSPGPAKLVTKYGKEEVLSFFEQDFLKATRWFSYFDEMKELEIDERLEMIQAIWHVFSRLYKLSTAAIGRRRAVCEDQLLMISHDTEYTVMDLTKIEFDYSWCTKYSNEQMQHFIDNTENSFLYKLVDYMVDLKPMDVELSFMICQACFHYAGQRFQGKILEVCEGFQERLANDLHDFYVEDWRMPNYSGRMSMMLRINNKIREDIWKCRQKQEIADIFDVYCIEYSHPEIFKDI